MKTLTSDLAWAVVCGAIIIAILSLGSCSKKNEMIPQVTTHHFVIQVIATDLDGTLTKSEKTAGTIKF